MPHQNGRHLMAHQMKNLCVFSVFHCVEGAFGASSGGTPKMKNGAPRDELQNGCGRGWAIPCRGSVGIKSEEGKWGRTKYRRIPKCEDDKQGRVPKRSLSRKKKLIKTRDLELPFFEGSLPSCSPHSMGYTRTFLHPYFPRGQ